MPTDPAPPTPETATQPPYHHPHDCGPSDDPVCSCEAEPRWLQFEQESENPRNPSEWDCLDRSPREEL